MPVKSDSTAITGDAAQPMAEPLPVRKRLPPILQVSPSTTKIPIVDGLPAIIFHRALTVRPQKALSDYLDLDLKTPRLNSIHQHLWLASRPNAARPLHKQKQLGRNLLITEDPDEHLVWFETQLFVKPLPRYLLDYDWWLKHLCKNENLYRSACGLLLSYAWLVCYQCDLDIAKEVGLLPRDIGWHKWVKFIESFLKNIDLVTMSDMNKRYQYGELRLSRLNSIYRFIPPAYSLQNFVRGYKSGSTWYAAYFSGYFRWLLAIFAIFSVALSAFQVGLATLTLQNNRKFGDASYGFMIAVLVSIVACVAIVFFFWLFLFCYHLLSTWRNNRRKSREWHREIALS